MSPRKTVFGLWFLMVLSCWWAPAVLAASFTDTASLDAALKDAGNVDGVLQLTPPGANLVLTGPVGGSTDGLSLDGQAGMVLGNNTFRLMDMGATGLGGVANIEMSNGRTTGNGGALLAGGLSAGIVNSAFRGNQAANGGGVYLSGSFSGGIRGLNGDTHFDSNTAGGQGGACMWPELSAATPPSRTDFSSTTTPRAKAACFISARGAVPSV